MTQNEIYNALANGGGYALPFLIDVYHPINGVLHFVNNTENIIYNDIEYIASTFNYTRPKTKGGTLKNGSLEITIINNELIEMLDASDELLKINAVGIIADHNTVTPFKSFMHQYGNITISDEMKLTISFTNDDRLEMRFPPYTFDSDNNRGNT